MGTENKSLENLVLVSSTENDYFARKISEYLDKPLAKTETKQFNDTDHVSRLNESESVRGKDVYLINTFYPPISDRLNELGIWIDALIGGSAERVTLVLPYLFGARQDRKTKRGEPINARAYINMLKGAAGDQQSRVGFLTAELHSKQIQGYAMYFDELNPRPIFSKHIKNNYGNNVTIVSPDEGAFKNSSSLKNMVNAEGLSCITKIREDSGEINTFGLNGDSVKGKTAIIMDDMIDSGGTLVKACKTLREEGAEKIIIYTTHLLLTNKDNLKEINADKIMGTDTVYHSQKELNSLAVETIPLSNVFGEAIKRKHQGKSTSDLYSEKVVNKCKLFDKREDYKDSKSLL